MHPVRPDPGVRDALEQQLEAVSFSGQQALIASRCEFRRRSLRLHVRRARSPRVALPRTPRRAASWPCSPRPVPPLRRSLRGGCRRGPACRLVSATMWTRTSNSFTWGSGHHSTWPGASKARASIVASLCSHTRRYRSMTSARDSCSVAHMVARRSDSMSHRGNDSGKGRPKTKPKYLASQIAKCLIRPRRLVPVIVSGRRASYSESPSTLSSIDCRTSLR